MRRLLLKDYNHLALENVASSVIKETEIRVSVKYAGISFTDIIIKRGWYKYQRKHMALPYVPGFEASGLVSEVGNSVAGIEIGDKVVVLRKNGCFAAEVITSAENIIKIPDETNLKLAASLPVNFFTAYHALHSIVTIFPNSKILIESAAGGVGGMIVQLASRAHLVSGLVGSQSKIDYTLSLGAKNVYEYKNLPENESYDAIFTSSGRNTSKYLSLLSTNGKLVTYGFHSLVPEGKISTKNILGYLTLPKFRLTDLVYNNKTVSGFNIIHLDPSSNEFTAAKESFLKEIASAELCKHTISCFPVKEFEEAFTLVENKNHQGKVLLKF